MRDRVTRGRIALARHVGPVFWPAWFIAPQWKRDQWHKIACELPPEWCPTCRRYYGLDNDQGDRDGLRVCPPTSTEGGTRSGPPAA